MTFTFFSTPDRILRKRSCAPQKRPKQDASNFINPSERPEFFIKIPHKIIATIKSEKGEVQNTGAAEPFKKLSINRTSEPVWWL